MVAPVTTARGVLLPATQRRDWPARVRGVLNVRRVLRELVETAVILALTTKTMPKTSDDVAIIAKQIATELEL